MKVNGEVTLIGSNLAEQKTEADVVAGTLTFADTVKSIEIFNTDQTNTGVFNVNGINIHVPPNTPVDYSVGGTPRNTVTVTGATTYIVSRLT